MVWEVRRILKKEDSELYLFSFVREVYKTTWLQGMTGISYRELSSLTDKGIPRYSVCVKDIKDSVWVLKSFLPSQLMSYSVLKLPSAFTLHQAWVSCQCLCDLFWLNSGSIGFLRAHPHHWTFCICPILFHAWNILPCLSSLSAHFFLSNTGCCMGTHNISNCNVE